MTLLLSAARSQSTFVHFRPGKWQVGDTTRLRLVQWVAESAKTGDTLLVSGHADTIGTSAGNLLVSGRRAYAVAALLDSILAEKQLVVLTKAFGAAFPVATNRTRAGRRQNRRVELLLRPLVQTVQTISANSSNPLHPIEDLYELIKSPGDSFCINPLRDTTLVGSRGTIVYYKPGVFKNAGNCGCIRLVLNEYFDKRSFILNNLTTTSQGLPLQSGGMTKMIGFCGTDTLQFEEGRSLLVMVPTDTVLPAMKMFSANRDRQSDLLDWRANAGDSLDWVDWERSLFACGWGKDTIKRSCPFFFCQIRQFFRSSRVKGRKQKQLDARNMNMDKERQLIEGLGLETGLLKPALDSSKIRNRSLLKYYVYKNASWDYRNLDCFQRGTKFTNFVVEEDTAASKDVKLVYKATKTVLPATLGKNYVFNFVSDSARVWIIGLQYKDRQSAWLSLHEENTATRKATLHFEEVRIEELQNLLRRLD